jgi:ubiquinone/menaquinone biosynthesis C-methylase UbiE
MSTPKLVNARHRVCPWWLGYLLASPLRRLLQRPEEILCPYVGEGMHALDVGCGMGFFSLPLARFVGKSGKVVCVDVQERMIQGLRGRARKAGLSEIIDARTCRPDSLGLDDISGTIDFVLAFAVVHEVPDKDRLLAEIRNAMKRTGKFLLAEPAAHVAKRDFGLTLSIAERSGFDVIADLDVRRSHARLLAKRP